MNIKGFTLLALALVLFPAGVWAEDVEPPAPLQGKDCGRTITIQERGDWQWLEPGLEYREMMLQAQGELSGVGVKLLRIDPEAIEVRVVHFQSLAMENSTVKELAERTGAVAAINGGFFGTNGHPLGFLMAAGRVINGRVRGRGRRGSLHYSAIFFIRDGKPFIVHRDSFSPSGVEHALQAGPYLIHQGKPTGGLDLYRENRRIAPRAAFALDRDRRLIALVTDSAINGLSWCELQALLLTPSQQGGLESVEALNLDGGSSAQLYVRVRAFSRHVMGARVPVAIGFYRRARKGG